MIIPNERKHSNFIFSKIIKLRIPKPKLIQPSHQFHQPVSKQLTLLQKTTISIDTQYPKHPLSKDKQTRYSKFVKTNRSSIERFIRRSEVRVRPIGIKKIGSLYKIKTLESDRRDQNTSQQNSNKRSDSTRQLLSCQYSSARFFNKSIERQKTVVKKGPAQPFYQKETPVRSDLSLKILPLIKQLCTFERALGRRKIKNTHFSFRKFDYLEPLQCKLDKQCEIRGWEEGTKQQEEEQNQSKMLAKYHGL